MIQGGKNSLEKEIEAYEYLKDNTFGSLSTLIEKIGKNFVDYLASAGILAFGINSVAERRYQVTTKGEKIIKIQLRALYFQTI